MALDLTIRTSQLPAGLMGLWDESTRTLWLDEGLSPPERRCTLVHELVHAERGDVPCGDSALDARQERRVEREAARRLVGFGELIDVLRWAVNAAEAAEVLGVDLATLEARLGGLTEREHDELARRCA